MKRRHWIATLLMFVLVFAQAITAAHACPIFAASSSEHLAQAASVDCATMAKLAGSTVNACELHCFATQVDAPGDAPTTLLAPQPALMVRVVDSVATEFDATSALSSICAAPPPLIRFSRLLI